jgi:nicotinamidase-related amidase
MKMLLVVDMQNGFMPDKCRHIIPVVTELIKHFLAEGKPVAFTRFINTANSSYVKLIHWSRVMQEPETRIIDELQQYTSTVFNKHYYSAFTEDFLRFISKNQIDKLYLCGVATDSCILKTAIDSFERDIEPIVVEDACFSHGGQQAHDSGLFLLRRNIGKNQIKMASKVKVRCSLYGQH